MEQFARTKLLLGDEGVEKLRKARVAVFGVGGVGGLILVLLFFTVKVMPSSSMEVE